MKMKEFGPRDEALVPDPPLGSVTGQKQVNSVMCSLRLSFVIWSFYFVSKYRRVEISIILAIDDEMNLFSNIKRT